MSLRSLPKLESKKKGSNSSARRAVQQEAKNYTYFDTLTLRPPPSSLLASVPRPQRGKVAGGLPLWDKKPLDAKLPLMQGPKGPFVFTRGKLGEKLWKGSEYSEFNLSDPYGREVKFDYEAAHDNHLRAWLRQPYTLSVLRANDVITPQQRVKCSVQQYNNYRQFLYNLYRDALRHEADLRENMQLERHLVKKANENTKKEAAKLKKFEDSQSKRLSNLNKLEALNLERLERCQKRLQRVIDQANRAEEKQQAYLVDRKRRMEAFDERIRTRVKAANYIERMNKIKAMIAWHKQDVEKKKQFEKRKQQRETEIKDKAEKRWKRKVEEQKKQIAKEEYLYEQKRKTMELFKQQYMKAMHKEWSKLEDQLNMRKCRGTIDKVKKDKRQKSMKQIMHSVSEAYSLRKSLGYLSQDEDAVDTLMERVQCTLREIRYDLEPYIVIAHAKGRLEKQENVPLPVSGAIKYLLEQTVVEYTAKQLSHTVENTAKKMLTAIDELKNQPTPIDRQSLSIKRSSLSAVLRMQSLSSQKATRISEVQVVIPVEKTSQELIVKVDELRRTRERAPTPMPSITTLTDVLFKEGDEEFIDSNFGEFSFIEQKKLNTVIGEVSNRIIRMIPARVRAVVESRSYDRISITNLSCDSLSEAILPENKPVAKLCSLILFEDSVRDHDLVTVVDRMILNFMQDIQLTPSYLRLKIKQRLEGIK